MQKTLAIINLLTKDLTSHNQYTSFLLSLKQYSQTVDIFIEENKLPNIKNLLGQGMIGYAFITTNSSVVLKISRNPTAKYEYALAQYAQKHPNPALCPIYATLKIEKNDEESDFYLMWKKKLEHTTSSTQLIALHEYYNISLDILSRTAKNLTTFGSIFEFKSNNFQDEINSLTDKKLSEVYKNAYENLQTIKEIEPYKHIALFLKNLLDKNIVIQDLRLDNLGINIIDNKPILSILDGILLTTRLV